MIPDRFATNPPPKLSGVQWLICIIASIGFAFDIYELLMLPLVVRPALLELGGIAPGTEEFGMWVGRLFYIPAIAGGIFGLLGGYLTDRLGRRRVLTWSILVYAFSAFAAGFSTSLWMLLFFRSTTFIGVCVEFVAAVAWLAELFSDPRQRERVLGYTQAFSSLGGLMVAVANSLAVAYAHRLWPVEIPEWLNVFDGTIPVFGGTIQDPHAPWRYTLMSGIIPAIPLVIIRPFLPESPSWQARKEAGTLKRPSIGELFAPRLCRTTLVTTLMFACSYGAAFGAIQMIPQIVPGLPQVKAQVAAAARVLEQANARAAEPRPADEVAKEIVAQKSRIEQKTAADVTKVQEVGGLVGRCLLAFLVVAIASRRRLLRVFQLPGLLVMPAVFAYAAVTSLPLLYVGIFFAGLLTVGQFSFWGNYLPRVYPIHLRGTGESFAANIGGRMIGTSFAWVTSTLAVQPFIPGDTPPTKLAYTAAGIGFLVYAAGTILCFWLPEPTEDRLPE